jgi:hypothetical protein
MELRMPKKSKPAEGALEVGQEVALKGKIIKTFDQFGEQWAIFKAETYPLPITLKAERFEPVE